MNLSNTITLKPIGRATITLHTTRNIKSKTDTDRFMMARIDSEVYISEVVRGIPFGATFSIRDYFGTFQHHIRRMQKPGGLHHQNFEI